MKRFAFLALSAIALGGASMAPAAADEPVGGITNSAGCGIHLENHGGASPHPFYKKDANGNYVQCTQEDARP